VQTAPENTVEPWTSGAVALNEGADRAEDNRGEEERKIAKNAKAPPS
jgi:hypothetical protein